MRGESWLIYFGSSMSGLRTFLAVWVSRWLRPPPCRSSQIWRSSWPRWRRRTPSWTARTSTCPSSWMRPPTREKTDCSSARTWTGCGGRWPTVKCTSTTRNRFVAASGVRRTGNAQLCKSRSYRYLAEFWTFRSNIERYFHTTSRYSSHTKTQGCK